MRVMLLLLFSGLLIATSYVCTTYLVSLTVRIYKERFGIHISAQMVTTFPDRVVFTVLILIVVVHGRKAGPGVLESTRKKRKSPGIRKGKQEKSRCVRVRVRRSRSDVCAMNNVVFWGPGIVPAK